MLCVLSYDLGKLPLPVLEECISCCVMKIAARDSIFKKSYHINNTYLVKYLSYYKFSHLDSKSTVN